ncbi:MAG: winged helix-turn-helix transcriptional regulator [Thermoplasmata archaeon]|nr:winged helix-turn-helix transcriptional regulator [Thermoplasmata archaeon]
MSLEVKTMVSIFMDRYSSQILLGTSTKAKGIRELSREYNIPVTVCYRRIKKLVEIGLLKEEKIGKRVKYRSKIEDFNALMDFEENKLRISMVADGEKYDVETTIL